MGPRTNAVLIPRGRIIPILLLSALLAACAGFKDKGGPGNGDAAVDDDGAPGDGGPSGDTGSSSDSGPAGDAGPLGDSSPIVDSSSPIDTGSPSKDSGPPPCDSSTCGIETVLTNLNQAGTLAVDSTNVYVEDQGTATGEVYQCPKTGCATPTLLGPGYATGIASDAQYVYWNDFSAGEIVRCAIGGCANAPTVLVPNQPHAEGLSFDGANLYWAATGNVMACTSPGCASPTILAGSQSTTIVTTSAETAVVYWVSSGAVRACPAAGCAETPTVIATVTAGAAGDDLVVKDGFVYFTSGNAVVSCPTTSACAFPHTIGSSYSPFGLATDGSYVYWLDDLIADVYRCPVTGCVGSAEVFADQSSFDPAGEIGTNVALDGEYVYWADPVSVYRKHM